MTQPVWRLVWRTDNEALFEDTTGVYPAELEVMQETGGEDDPVEVYRFPIERLQRCPGFPETVISGKWTATWPHAAYAYKEWFSDDLERIADSAGWELEELRNALCSERIGERAAAYLAIAVHHGLANFDQYPLNMTYEEWESRWDDHPYLKAEVE